MAKIIEIRPGLGSGIYTYSEAGKLLCVSALKVRRWAEGYIYPLTTGEKQAMPVLQRRNAKPGLLIFHDLIEMFFVKEYRKVGVKLQEIRDAAELLAEKLETPYPFAHRNIKTDGAQLLLEAGEHYLRVARHQQVFKFAEEFFKNIDFDGFLAELWWPLGREKMIVVDPSRSFGSPIDVKSGMRTDIIYATYKAENDFQLVAEWYGILEEAVEAAVEFETKWCKAA